MSRSNEPPPAPATLQCGDCRAPITHPIAAPAEDDYYCPLCARPVPAPLECPTCGSTICPRCGTPLERADELGIG